MWSNNKIRRLAGKDHPSFFEALHNLRLVEALAAKTQIDLTNGYIYEANKVRKYTDLNDQIVNILNEDYHNYISKVQILRKFALKIKMDL